MSPRAGIRLDRRVDLAWLDAVAAQVAAGHDAATTRAILFELLNGKIAGGMKSDGACQKTIRVLMRTWLDVPEELVTYRDRAVKCLPSLSSPERLGLHWAMLLAGYRFFGDVAEHTGRLLSLQGNLTMAQVSRRMRETWGDRSTLNRATQRVVRSMVEWGVLEDTEKKGFYSQISRSVALHGELALVLVEALLLHTGNAIPIQQVIEHPALFPFEMELSIQGLRQSARFEVHRQGLDVDVVGLRDGGGLGRRKE
jgi:hypothetical protein